MRRAGEYAATPLLWYLFNQTGYSAWGAAAALHFARLTQNAR